MDISFPVAIGFIAVLDIGLLMHKKICRPQGVGI
jgi:hypothetical protein